MRSSLYFEPRLAGFVGGYYWPEGIEREDTVTAWMQLFELHGYHRCDTAALEPGMEKVAIYGDTGGEAHHVARQLPSGAWTSKIGKLHDIEHSALDALAGEDYGSVVAVMRRPTGA